MFARRPVRRRLDFGGPRPPAPTPATLAMRALEHAWAMLCRPDRLASALGDFCCNMKRAGVSANEIVSAIEPLATATGSSSDTRASHEVVTSLIARLRGNGQ